MESFYYLLKNRPSFFLSCSDLPTQGGPNGISYAIMNYHFYMRQNFIFFPIFMV